MPSGLPLCLLSSPVFPLLLMRYSYLNSIGEHLHLLARLHQRRLAPQPEESAAPEVLAPPELSAVLLAMPEHLAALQAQISALQHQVADLTRLMQQPRPDPIVPLTQTQPSSTVKHGAKPTRSASGLHPAAKTPPKSDRKSTRLNSSHR